MTEIAMRAEPAAALTAYNDNAMERLGRWVQQADAVFALADRICSTSFAPAAYRGKPAEAAAAMLAGAELGFDPMASLRAFDNIQGIPAPKAITLRAVVQGAGHDLDIVESDATHAVAMGRRKGTETWVRIEWTIERATLAGYVAKNKKYETNPEEMLVARATSEGARRIAADAVMGMPYSAEEISDEPVLAPAPAVRRLSAADLEAPAIEAPADEPLTDDQRKRMFALWGEIGYAGDENRATRLDLTAKFIGADAIESSSDLTRAEADVVIARLLARKEQMAAGGAE